MPLVWIANVASESELSKATAAAEVAGIGLDIRVGISDEELISLLNRATAMVYAPRLEPFGLAPLEAAACGLPVVAVAEGGVRETVVDGLTGRLVADSSSLAEAVDALVADPDEARRLGENARERVEKAWSMDSAIDKLERELQRLCKQL